MTPGPEFIASLAQSLRIADDPREPEWRRALERQRFDCELSRFAADNAVEVVRDAVAIIESLARRGLR